MSELTVFLTTWNTGLQGSKAQSQDLTSWLLPVLHSTANDPDAAKVIPDLYVIGVQELLPLHLALAGLSGPVLLALTERIQSLLSAHAKSLSEAKDDERYYLVQRVSHVGVAMWVFARQSTMTGKLGKALTSSLGLWWCGMGNKGAVGVRLPVQRGPTGAWETLTFVNAHLEAHDHNLKRRNQQYANILSSMVFRATDPLQEPKQAHETSHLFVMGDLNYRLVSVPSSGYPREPKEDEDVLTIEKERMEMVDLDSLRKEQREGRVFGGLREGDLSRFAPTYKRIVGQVEGYSKKRIPGYTDRILFGSWTDPAALHSPQATIDPIPGPAPASTTQIAHFNATPHTVLSDHKPVHAILVLPPASHSAASPHLAPELRPAPPPHPPRPAADAFEIVLAYKVLGTLLDRAVGWPWTVMVLLGFGNVQAGMGVSAFIAMVWGAWWSGIWSG